MTMDKYRFFEIDSSSVQKAKKSEQRWTNKKKSSALTLDSFPLVFVPITLGAFDKGERGKRRKRESMFGRKIDMRKENGSCGS